MFWGTESLEWLYISTGAVVCGWGGLFGFGTETLPINLASGAIDRGIVDTREDVITVLTMGSTLFPCMLQHPHIIFMG